MLIALLAMAVLPAAMAGGEEPREWIKRMNTALSTRSYDGVFVHQVGAHREVLRVVHRMQDGQMAERVVSTDGSGREFLRNGSKWVAFYPDQHIALVQTRNRSYGFLTALNGLNPESDRYYAITDGGEARLQGRLARHVKLEPRDALRYGYRLWVDVATGLPLKTQLVARSGEIIEEIAFISLSLPEKISDEQLKPEVDTRGFRWLRRDVPMYTPGFTAKLAPQASLLPAGFRVRIFTPPEEEARAPGPRTRFIVSDGVAWVSVFIEKPEPGRETPPAKDARPDGVVMVGSSAVYVTKAEGYRITVVGEVPPVTVRTIAEAVRSEGAP